MNTTATSARGRTRPIFFIGEFLMGAIKLLIVLSPIWLIALVMVADGDCRGDCAVGMGMAIGLGIALYGPLVLIIGVPIVFFVTRRWTRGRPLQSVGAVALIPVLLVVLSGYHKLEAALIRAELRPQYLSRSVENPAGKVEHLVLAGSGGSCNADCQSILVNGIADKFSYGYIDSNGGSQTPFERIFRLSRISDCKGNSSTIASSLEYLQSHGIFDVCVVEASPNTLKSVVVIGGSHYDRERVARRYGLVMATVAQHLVNGALGPELMRWEYGALPGTNERLGEPFTQMDFIRAFTGIKTDRLAALEKLTHSERLDHILASGADARLQLLPVLAFISAAPGAWAFGSTAKEEREQTMSADDIAKLRSIATSICTRTPSVPRFGKSIECASAYNDHIREHYPRQAEALMLPNSTLQ